MGQREDVTETETGREAAKRREPNGRLIFSFAV